jgi:hypothetical protein
LSGANKNNTPDTGVFGQTLRWKKHQRTMLLNARSRPMFDELEFGGKTYKRPLAVYQTHRLSGSAKSKEPDTGVFGQTLR